MDVPKTKGVTDKQREFIAGFDPKRLQEIVKNLREKTAKKKVNPKDLEKLSQQYLEEMNAPVRWALEGIVYAYYLSPDDLVVSEDPLLLRKHEFWVKGVAGVKTRLHEPADVNASSERAGSYFTGGFASFGNAYGPVPAFPLLTLTQKGSLFATRPTLAGATATRAELEAVSRALFQVVKAGKVKIKVNQRYALKDAAQAHIDLEARKTTGSTVLVP